MVNWTLDIQVLDRQDLGNADFIQFQNFTQEEVATDDFGELSSRAIGVSHGRNATYEEYLASARSC